MAALAAASAADAFSHALIDMPLQLALGASETDFRGETCTGTAEAEAGRESRVHTTTIAIRIVTFFVYINMLYTIVASSGKQMSPMR